MGYLHTIFLVLFFILSAFFSIGVKETFADNYITQVSAESSSSKVKKLQEVFKGLGLYSGEINGDFFSIRESLIDYQVENGIIPSRDNYEAGYFGRKTIRSLEKTYGKDFEELREEYLKMETPKISQEGYFIVTAYYSPVPGQSRYYTGSYEAEKRLNGGGNTASGKKPYFGVIAAPSNYKFGTKIFLEGLGTMVVEDRGGAIVNSGDRGQLHDRIDVWMGKGDEGLRRTLSWGRKTIKGTIVDSSDEVNVIFVNNDEKDLDDDTIDDNLINEYRGLYVSAEKPNSNDVKKLQELLKKVNLYNGEIDGDYFSFNNILIDFQVKNNIIPSRFSDEAGYFGRKTFDTFKNIFGENFEKVEEYKNNLDENISKEETENKENNDEIIIERDVDDTGGEKKDILDNGEEGIETDDLDINNSLKIGLKKKLKSIKEKLLKNLDEKYNSDSEDIKSHIIKIREALTKYMVILKSDEEKEKIKYFINIL